MFLLDAALHSTLTCQLPLPTFSVYTAVGSSQILATPLLPSVALEAPIDSQQAPASYPCSDNPPTGPSFSCLWGPRDWSAGGVHSLLLSTLTPNHQEQRDFKHQQSLIWQWRSLGHSQGAAGAALPPGAQRRSHLGLLWIPEATPPLSSCALPWEAWASDPHLPLSLISASIPCLL